MSDDYPLEVLLEIRASARDDAEAELARRVGELQKVEARRERAREQVEDIRQRQVCARAERERVLQQGMAVSDLRVADEYASALAVEVAGAEAKLEEISGEWRDRKREVERARHELGEAQKELLAVEKHHEGWSEEQAMVARRKASDAMDEIAMRTWQKDTE